MAEIIWRKCRAEFESFLASIQQALFCCKPLDSNHVIVSSCFATWLQCANCGRELEDDVKKSIRNITLKWLNGFSTPDTGGPVFNSCSIFPLKAMFNFVP